MERTITINDDLDARVKSCKEELVERVIDCLNEHNDIKDADELYQLYIADTFFEITDSNTPIYNFDIDGLYFLYGNEFDTAYENAGIGTKTENNYRQVAIMCYLNEKLSDFWHDDLSNLVEQYINEPKTLIAKLNQCL